MLIDTHCHINMMVKKTFDLLMSKQETDNAHTIVDHAAQAGVTTLINVGTSLVESINCIKLAQLYGPVYATVGIHPNDCSPLWQDDLKQLQPYLENKEKYKIVAIGEIGLDKHYPDYNLQRQKDALKAQIECALAHNLAIVIHSRDAAQETLESLQEYKNDITQCVIHCFSEDLTFAQQVIEWGFFIGIGGIITYPKNDGLRSVVKQIPLENIVLETDAPYLPIQRMRGKKNAPQYISDIAHYIAEIRGQSFEEVAQQTTHNARTLFNL